MGNRGEVFDVGLPGDRGRIVGARLPAAALVVEDELEVIGGTTVKDEQASCSDGAVGAPVERDGGRCRETGVARRWDRRHGGWEVVGGKLACEWLC